MSAVRFFQKSSETERSALLETVEVLANYLPNEVRGLSARDRSNLLLHGLALVYLGAILPESRRPTSEDGRLPVLMASWHLIEAFPATLIMVLPDPVPPIRTLDELLLTMAEEHRRWLREELTPAHTRASEFWSSLVGFDISERAARCERFRSSRTATLTEFVDRVMEATSGHTLGAKSRMQRRAVCKAVGRRVSDDEFLEVLCDLTAAALTTPSDPLLIRGRSGGFVPDVGAIRDAAMRTLGAHRLKRTRREVDPETGLAVERTRRVRVDPRSRSNVDSDAVRPDPKARQPVAEAARLERIRAVQRFRDDLRDPADLAAFERLCNGEARRAVAERYGVTPRRVELAEGRLLPRLRDSLRAFDPQCA